MFRATKGSGVTITTIFRNNSIETRPGNKIHHLREKRSACVHCAPDWKTKIGEDVTLRILDRVQGATKKNTSETPVLQRYFEIVPSVNRTAVMENGDKFFAQTARVAESIGSGKFTTSSTGTITGGTGKFFGIEGIVQAVGTDDPKAGFAEAQYDIEYRIEK
jgi:hypothetical protein